MKRLAMLVPVLMAGMALGAPQATQQAGPPAATAEEQKLINRSSSIAYVEVTAVSRQDGRAADGPLTETIEMKKLDGEGAFLGSLTIVVDQPSMMAGAPPFKPSGPVLPGSMVKGKRYWLTFLLDNRAPLGPVALMWPEEKAPLKELKERMAVLKIK